MDRFGTVGELSSTGGREAAGRQVEGRPFVDEGPVARKLANIRQELARLANN